jgi:toxin ParE1/3/4
MAGGRVTISSRAVIAYKVDGDRVRIVNIFYGGRDYESLYHGIATEDDGE